MARRARRPSPLAFLFITVFVDMVGYGLVIPLLPFYARQYAAGATLIGLLTLGTALIHLQLAFPDPVFILNGLGYLTLLVALYLP